MESFDYFIVCDTVYAECKSLIPLDMKVEVLPFSLHSRPEYLKNRLQEVIDRIPDEARSILLGFGLCSHAVVGLRSEKTRLILPRIHDCIALFCGSQECLANYAEEELGTLYLTKRFIEAEDGTYHLLEYDAYEKKYGKRKAETYIGMVLKSYKCAAFLETGEYESDTYKHIVKKFCKTYSLVYKDIAGTQDLMKLLVSSSASPEKSSQLIYKKPGECVELSDYIFI